MGKDLQGTGPATFFAAQPTCLALARYYNGALFSFFLRFYTIVTMLLRRGHYLANLGFLKLKPVRMVVGSLHCSLVRPAVPLLQMKQ